MKKPTLTLLALLALTLTGCEESTQEQIDALYELLCKLLDNHVKLD